MNRHHKITRIFTAIASACAFLFLGIGSVQAALLQPPGVVGQLFFNLPSPPGIQVNTFGTFPLSGPLGDLKLTVSGTPAPFISADATVAPFFFGRTSAILTYQMEILGATGDVPVTVTVAGGVVGASDLSIDSFAGFAMKSYWSLAGFDPSSGFSTIIEDGITTPSLTGAFSQSFSQTYSLMLTANQVFNVTLIADAGVRAGSASAFIDPTFSFGPGVGPGYSFQFSDGIGNTAVPIPSSFTLFGLGIIAFSLYRRSQRNPRVAESGIRSHDTLDLVDIRLLKSGTQFGCSRQGRCGFQRPNPSLNRNP